MFCVPGFSDWCRETHRRGVWVREDHLLWARDKEPCRRRDSQCTGCIEDANLELCKWAWLHKFYTATNSWNAKWWMLINYTNWILICTRLHCICNAKINSECQISYAPLSSAYLRVDKVSQLECSIFGWLAFRSFCAVLATARVGRTMWLPYALLD